MPASLFDKLWQQALVQDLGDGRGLVHIDRHLLHELTSPQAFDGLALAGRQVVSPALTFAVPDHIVDTVPGRADPTVPGGRALLHALRDHTRRHAIELFDLDDPRHGIVHVTAAEQGLVMPGMTVVCGDSHTCTLGALGAWAFGIGTSDVEHVLATQTLVLRKPASRRLHLTGRLPPHVTAKDLALAVIARFGVQLGAGGVLELCGPTVAALSMSERFTLCNLGIEAGARATLIAPDDTTLAYLRGRPRRPADFDAAATAWRRLRSDPGAAFEAEHTFDAGGLAPQVSWGTNPSQTIGIDDVVPAPANASAARALDYMGLRPGQALTGLPVQTVFIGSCTNARLEDLQLAARCIEGGHVADGVRALVVPGSAQVKREAEALQLDRVFERAGFAWREPGCSMCIGMNGDHVAPGERCLSTSNRNFEGRQGPGARTHLVSPAVAAVSALRGVIADPREGLA